ncbi:hypothetical protein [Paenibacillus agricola]|uniref:Uncharacterized protein n=1 Tax=Paenibacillus agricola TaxID=2716264 RepID=A0ABX0JDM6_9BACL|nr:hypothetical protein [Paenibacillus agricola]NHN32319.1 hypothetical protein [Paenibacillus agricola]
MRKFMLTIMITSLFSILMAGFASAATDGGYAPVPKNMDTRSAYIQDIYVKNEKTYMVVDYIEWYEGKEADQVFAKRESEFGLDGAPSGYYIINDNTKLRTFEIQADSAVFMQIYNRTGKPGEADIVWNESIALSKFKEIFAKDAILHEYPYHLSIQNGKVSKIIQQFIP